MEISYIIHTFKDIMNGLYGFNKIIVQLPVLSY